MWLYVSNVCTLQQMLLLLLGHIPEDAEYHRSKYRLFNVTCLHIGLCNIYQ